MKARWELIVKEFARHLPFTLIGSLIAMAGVWWFGMRYLDAGRAAELFMQSRNLFHLFHPLHICLSALATTSLFWRHERHMMRAVAIGSLGTVLPCGLSDSIFPYLGGRLLGQHMELHICAVEHPQLFVPFLVCGIAGGFVLEERLAGSHLLSHGMHVLVSSAASLLYLISFGFIAWMTEASFFIPAFLVIVVAVWVPCCISDILTPAASVHLPAARAGSARAGAEYARGANHAHGHLH